jgi:hypothetical protein
MEATTEATEQERRVHRAVQDEAMRMYENRRPPAHAKQLACLHCVVEVLRAARCVLRELQIAPEALDRLEPAELAPYWDELLRQLADAPPSDPVDVGACSLALVRRIAGGLHAMHWQSLRYTHFLSQGAPAGVAELPSYTRNQGQKSFALSNRWFSVPGKSTAHFTAVRDAAPRRRIGLRASQGEMDDLANPRAFV